MVRLAMAVLTWYSQVVLTVGFSAPLQSISTANREALACVIVVALVCFSQCFYLFVTLGSLGCQSSPIRQYQSAQSWNWSIWLFFEKNIIRQVFLTANSFHLHDSMLRLVLRSTDDLSLFHLHIFTL